jgi:hypothetical protein
MRVRICNTLVIKELSNLLRVRARKLAQTGANWRKLAQTGASYCNVTQTGATAASLCNSHDIISRDRMPGILLKKVRNYFRPTPARVPKASPARATTSDTRQARQHIRL